MSSRDSRRQLTPGGSVTGLDLNEGMLKAAQRLPLPPGLGNRLASGQRARPTLFDGAFGGVLCQQGLQLFPDRLKALREMRRVLASAGRVALTVWTGPSPYFVAEREGLARHVSPEAATSIATAFSLPDADELRGLLEGAGFREVGQSRQPSIPYGDL